MQRPRIENELVVAYRRTQLRPYKQKGRRKTNTKTKTVNAPAVRLIAARLLVNMPVAWLRVNDNENEDCLELRV